jgi:hypothetical protein
MISPRPRHLAVAILAVVALVAVSSAAWATTPTPARASKPVIPYWRQVTWTNTAPPIIIGSPQCSTAGPCLYPWTEAGVAHGDLEGTYIASGVATASPTGVLEVSRMDVFTGTIAGCGTGTITTRGIEQIDPTKPAPGSMKVVSAFGTGELSRVQGFGQGIGGTTPTGLTATINGSIHCGRAR